VYEVGEINTSILSQVLLDSSQLVGVENPKVHSIILHALCQHLLKEFAQGIQENDGMKHLWNIMSGFAWFRNDNRYGLLEDVWPKTCGYASISQLKKKVSTVIIHNNRFKMSLHQVVRAWCGSVRSSAKALLQFIYGKRCPHLMRAGWKNIRENSRGRSALC
jgi:hypothetical protein